MVSSKYYVYGGGRWRELDAATGRVSGWSGARLCVARRGRLLVRRGAARRRLLAALRALAAGQPSAARDGPRLAHKPLHKSSSRSRSRCRSRTRCRCCCHHNNRCEGETGARSLTSDACIQTAPPRPPPRLAFPPSTLRNHVTGPSPTARNTSTPIKKHNTAISPSKKRNSSTSWKQDDLSSSDSTEPLTDNTNTSTTKKANMSLKRKRQKSDSSDISKDEISMSQSILKKDFNAKYLRPRKSVRRDGPSRASPSRASPSRASPSRASPSRASPSRARAPRIRTRVIPGQVIHISSDDENKDPTVNYTSLKNTRDTETEEEKTKGTKSIDLFSQKSSKMDVYRELVISEEEVEVLRTFMMRTEPGFDLYRYDNDDTYKARFFYSINPLVSIERCPRIAAMLEGRGGLSLQQFASQLGLRSVSSVPPSARGRRRRYHPVVEEADSEDKENVRTVTRSGRRGQRAGSGEGRNTRGGGEVLGNVSQMTEVTVHIERLKDARRGTGDKGAKGDVQRGRERQSSGELEGEGGRSEEHTHTGGHTRRGNKETSDVPNNIVRKRANVAPTDNFRSKEYSSLEDHAIIAWISSGNRANLVNGNRVWRSLEQSFEEVGGRARSWHSLRNRYLRHLLPALGRLQLPPAQQARLRAAAARGEIKGNKAARRRNSIYGEPARGAASRRPGPPRRPPPPTPPKKAVDPDWSESSTPPPAPRPSPRAARTPRYSEVTRQFAARRPPASSSSSSEFESPVLRPRASDSRRSTLRAPAPAPGPGAPAPAPRSRTRKLYNPNKL